MVNSSYSCTFCFGKVGRLFHRGGGKGRAIFLIIKFYRRGNDCLNLKFYARAHYEYTVSRAGETKFSDR